MVMKTFLTYTEDDAILLVYNTTTHAVIQLKRIKADGSIVDLLS